MPTRAAERLFVAATLALSISGCAATGRVEASLSRGASNRGWLEHGVALPDRGAGFVRARPGEETRYGTPRLVEALQRAAATVDRDFPGTPPLRVGDLSYPQGGRHPRHGSHRSGRDVDLIFYASELAGLPVPGRGWIAYDRLGFGAERAGRRGERGRRIDLARSWALVEALLLDPTIDVEWIFCSAGVKARLLRYAARHDVPRKLYFRAAWVLHQPRNARAHDDHFHVRIRCSTEERALGCYDRGPDWPWLDAALAKPAPVADRELLAAILTDG